MARPANARTVCVLAACAALAHAESPRRLLRVEGMRADGAPVFRAPASAVRDELLHPLRDLPTYPFKPFSDAYVAMAKASPTDWVQRGAVTPAKDQGATGACGTFGRTAAAEGQFALRGGGPLSNFSEGALDECVGWDMVDQQQEWFSSQGWMTTEDYPYNNTAPTPGGDVDPPVPGRPCKWDASKVVPHSGGGAFTNATGAAPSEDQLIAFLPHNGPVQTGIYSDVFALRTKGCEATQSCWITQEMCASVAGKDIDHSITLVGYGTDAARGDYWIVRVARGTRAENWRQCALRHPTILRLPRTSAFAQPLLCPRR